jgi:hypothetical protein
MESATIVNAKNIMSQLNTIDEQDLKVALRNLNPQERKIVDMTIAILKEPSSAASSSAHKLLSDSNKTITIITKLRRAGESKKVDIWNRMQIWFASSFMGSSHSSSDSMLTALSGYKQHLANLAAERDSIFEKRKETVAQENQKISRGALNHKSKIYNLAESLNSSLNITLASNPNIIKQNVQYRDGKLTCVFYVRTQGGDREKQEREKEISHFLKGIGVNFTAVDSTLCDTKDCVRVSCAFDPYEMRAYVRKKTKSSQHICTRLNDATAPITWHAVDSTFKSHYSLKASSQEAAEERVRKLLALQLGNAGSELVEVSFRKVENDLFTFSCTLSAAKADAIVHKDFIDEPLNVIPEL